MRLNLIEKFENMKEARKEADKMSGKSFPIDREALDEIVRAYRTILMHPETWESVCADCVCCVKEADEEPYCTIDSENFTLPDGCYMFESDEDLDEEISDEQMEEDLRTCSVVFAGEASSKMKEAATTMMKEILRDMEERKRKTEGFQTCEGKAPGDGE